MSKFIMLLSVLVPILASASEGNAKVKSFIINGTDMKAPNGGAITAGVETFEGAAVGDGGFGQITVYFTLPGDYKKNSPVTVELRMFGGGSSCVVSFGPDAVLRYRNNAVKTTALGQDSGLSANEPVEFLRPADFNLIKSRTYTLRKIGTGTIQSGTMRDQRPGDGINLVFIRLGGFPQDTCSSALFINSAKITYTTN